MTLWRCRICGYIHQGDEPPKRCRYCGAPKEEFVQVRETDVGPSWSLDIRDDNPKA